MSRPTSPRFTVHCKLTCLGGSETGECECACPNDCTMTNDPGFQQARENAKARMGRYLMDRMPDAVKDALKKPRGAA